MVLHQFKTPPEARHWEFPKIRGTLFWGPYTKDPTRSTPKSLLHEDSGQVGFNTAISAGSRAALWQLALGLLGAHRDG